MWPHYFGAVYASKDAKTFRRNAVFLPLYQLVLLFVFFVGFTAFLVVPGLANGDLSLLRRSPDALPPAVVGHHRRGRAVLRAGPRGRCS